MENAQIVTLLNDLMDTVKTGFNQVNQRLDNLEQRIDKLEQRMDKLEQRMDNLEQRMDNLEQRMDNLEQRMDKVESEVQNLKEGQIVLTQYAETISADLDDLKKSIHIRVKEELINLLCDANGNGHG